jgi:hypothetical protein
LRAGARTDNHRSISAAAIFLRCRRQTLLLRRLALLLRHPTTKQQQLVARD